MNATPNLQKTIYFNILVNQVALTWIWKRNHNFSHYKDNTFSPGASSKQSQVPHLRGSHKIQIRVLPVASVISNYNIGQGLKGHALKSLGKFDHLIISSISYIKMLPLVWYLWGCVVCYWLRHICSGKNGPLPVVHWLWAILLTLGST